MAIEWQITDNGNIKDQIGRFDDVIKKLSGGYAAKYLEQSARIVRENVTKNLTTAASEHRSAISGQSTNSATPYSPVSAVIAPKMMMYEMIDSRKKGPIAKVHAGKYWMWYLRDIEYGRKAIGARKRSRGTRYVRAKEIAKWESILGLKSGDDALEHSFHLNKVLLTSGVRADPVMRRSFNEVRRKVLDILDRIPQDVVGILAGKKGK